jgi:hypothetical protein
MSTTDQAVLDLYPQVTKRSISDFSGYLCLEEDSSDELEITQHPVQRGANITDHAYLKPSTVSIRFSYAPGTTPLSQLYTELRDLQASREPFTIVTGKRVYSNMLFKSLSVTTDVTKENILSVIGNFQEVILVDVVSTTVPVRAKQKQPENTDSTQNVGDKKAMPVDENKVSQSTLSSLFNTNNING